MTAQIKYLIFKGIEKKEQILFKSFLNLAKAELAYQVVILKSDVKNDDAPDMIIMDESYQFDENEQALRSLPTVLIGDDLRDDALNYVSRPVQWSDFKIALTSLDISLNEDEVTLERVLPSDIKFAISDATQTTIDTDSVTKDCESEELDSYDYELGNMTVDYHSITNSDYMKVVEDVRQFENLADSNNSEAVILITDDESASSNSVLVIETDSLDAWDFSETETTQEDGDSHFDFNARNNDVEPSDTEVFVETKVGKTLKPGEEYWLEDNEMIANNKIVLIIKADRGMVYSDVEPGKWLSFVQRSNLTKLPLSVQWHPNTSVKGYPLERLIWADTLVNQGSQLLQGLEEDEKYILKCWPKFELLEFDNILLKLCSMLFVQPESVTTLAQKSGYGRSTIRGLINACYESGILKMPHEVNLKVLTKPTGSDGMLTKIKDAFR